LGDAAQTSAAALAAEHVVAGADLAGKLRVGGVLGLVVAGAVLVWLVRRWLRRRRARPAANPEPEAAPENDEVATGAGG
jgi:hypothetical protein